MEQTTTLTTMLPLPGTTGVLDVPKKITVIRLRWLVIIICSYLLLFSSGTWLGAGAVQGFILLYVLTNAVLYFLDDSLFDSTYFYSPLVIFDTLFVTASLVMSGQVETDFYLAYFLIIILCTIWQDFRGVIVVTILSTLLYGYFLFQATEIHDPSIYLRIPFLFVISLFYGYFAQVVRVEKTLKEQARQEAHDMAMIQSLSQSLPSSLDYKLVLDTLGEKINSVIKADQFYIITVDETHDPSRGFLFGEEKREGSAGKEINLGEYPIVQECLMKRSPVINRREGPLPSWNASGALEGLPSFLVAMAIPITFRGETHGAILLGFNQKNRVMSSREIQFCQIVAFSTAIALSNAKKYEELQTEARRRQTILEELAAANRLKSEYLANTSHELRTPLATIIGYGHLLADEACGSLTDEQKNAMSRLMKNARNLRVLVDEILDYSKLEKGEVNLFMKRQEAGVLIDELRRELSPLEATRPYKIRYEIEGSIPPIETDWAKLKSILVNILNNAVKFTARGGVKLSVKNRTNGEIAFIVSDTGIGIPKDKIPLIFEKFRQLDGSPARRYEGTGLGLTISKNLAALIGGEIEVESEVGRGSTFTVTIPITYS